MAALRHFKNFLGPHGSSICGELDVPEELLTLVPAVATCQRCLQALRRLPAAFGAPIEKKSKGET